MLTSVSPRPAFLTDDSATILRFAVDAIASGAVAALVTLVEIRGGSARRLGSQMAVREDGCYCGFVSGGCTEAAVATEALEAIAAGEDRRVSFGQGSTYFDIVLPCGGGITLDIHVLRSPQPLLAVLAALDARTPAGLRYAPGPNTLEYVPRELVNGWNGPCFDIGYRPRTRLLLYGRSIEVEATAKLAQAACYEVHVSDGSNARSTSTLIDADSAVALLFHDLDRELPALRAALAASPFYIGALGSTRTHQRRIKALAELGYSERDIARIKAPIGIFSKARDAHALALSVLADLAAARTE
ncbi:XdhC family protein [Frateuria defendens]|uniref:XdhC family protein n=1 Tax=Frateuria defendens TaxID=2219559 RepID=UPI00066FFB09|nr:XdhC family protein [Frateuria defendens]